MSKLSVYNLQGETVGSLEIADETLILDKGEQAVHDVIVATTAARRAGTASTLTKGEVAGSNRKPWKQKGTGRARAGYRQSPVWRGGAVAFGPRPRDFSVKVNKKVRRLAMRRAFSERLAAGDVRVVESLTLPEAKTKTFAAMMQKLGVAGGALFIVERIENDVARASRNIPNAAVASARNVDAYRLLQFPAIVLTKGAMAEMQKRLTDEGGTAE